MRAANQIARLDVAIKSSRVHAAFRCNELDGDQTVAIFRAFLEPLEEKGLLKEMDGINAWLEEDVWRMRLDGGQIRNIVSSAVGRARAGANGAEAKLTKKHLRAMISNVDECKDGFMQAFERCKNSQRGDTSQHQEAM